MILNGGDKDYGVLMYFIPVTHYGDSSCPHQVHPQIVVTLQIVQLLRPPLNKKSFPVHRPGGVKRAEWEVLFHVFNQKKIVTPPSLYILVYKNGIRKTNKNPDPADRKRFFT